MSDNDELEDKQNERFHKMFTKELGPGEKYIRPTWHEWVYGGGKNPVNDPRYRWNETKQRP